MGKVVDSILGGIVDVVEDVAGAIVDLVASAWQDVIVPVIGEILTVFGIDDETVITVSKVSIPILGDDPNNIIKQTMTRTVLGMSNNDGGFFANYQYQFNKHKSDIAAYYRYGKGGNYVYGLPTLTVNTNKIDMDVVSGIINTALAGDYTAISSELLTTQYSVSNSELFVKYFLHNDYDYSFYKNTLSYAEGNGVVHDDWTLVSINKKSLLSEVYEAHIERRAYKSDAQVELSEIFVNEGDSVDLTLRLNRAVPAGSSLTFNINYSGALGSEFSAPSSITVDSEDVSKTVTITGISPASVKVLEIELVVPDTNLYDSLSVWFPNKSLNLTLVPAGVVALCIGQVSVNKGNSIDIPVKLSGDVPGGFTVDFSTNSTLGMGLLLPAVDYSWNVGPLTFVGDSGELQNIHITTITENSSSLGSMEIIVSNPSNTNVSTYSKGLLKVVDYDVEFPYSRVVYLKQIIEYVPAGHKTYIVTKYRDNTSNDPNEWLYWFYDVKDETYPSINPIKAIDTSSEMLPVAILRQNRQFINQEKNVAQEFYEDFGIDTDIYKSTNTILKKLGINATTIIDTITDNPDIDLIDDVYINFAMAPSDSNKILSKLLWSHLYNIVVERNAFSVSGKYYATFREQDVNNALVWSKSTYLTNVSVHNNSYLANQFVNFEDANIGDCYHTSGPSSITVMKKVSEYSVDILTVLHIAGLNTISLNGYTNVAANNPSDEAFTIPVSWYLLNKLSGPEVTEVLPYILRLDIFAIELTHLNFYETEEFAVLIKVVMIIINIYSLGSSSSLTSLLYSALFNFAIVQIVIYIAKLTGNAELAAIIGVVAAVVLGSEIGMSFDMMSAEGLTNIVTTFSSTLGAAQNVELKELQEDLTDLIDEFEKQQELHDETSYSSTVLGGAEYWSLKSSDVYMYESREIQFNFDLLFDYDNIISNFYDQQLSVSKL